MKIKLKYSTKIYRYIHEVCISFLQLYYNINEIAGYKVTTSSVVNLAFPDSREIAVWDALAQSLLIFSVGEELEGFESLDMGYQSNNPNGDNVQQGGKPHNEPAAG